MSSGTTQKLHPILATADVDDGWSLGSEQPKAAVDPAAQTRKLQSMPRLATPIADDAGDFPLATARTLELPKPALGSPLPSLKRKHSDASAATQNLKKPATGALPSYWSEAKLPRPMARLAEGTMPEHEPPADLVPVVAPKDESVPSLWAKPESAPQREPAEEIKSAAPENDAGFSEVDQAFFAEGEALATKKQTVDEFVDLADRELSFWQRFWKR